MQQVDDRLALLENRNLAPANMHLAAIECVIRTMHEHMYESLSLDDMADVACLSPYYFSRMFHQIIGLPPGEFLATLRLERAKRLLLTTPMSVTDICFEVGYNSLGTFTTRFTQQVGLPPRSLRHFASNIPVPNFVQLRGTRPTSRKGVGGRMFTAVPFNGLIFAGLFPKLIPQGRPVNCTLLTEAGPYHIGPVPDGCYFLLAAALPVSENPHTYFLPQKDILVGIQGPLMVQNGQVQRTIDVFLRPPRLTDPPIISALPFI